MNSAFFELFFCNQAGGSECEEFYSSLTNDSTAAATLANNGIQVKDAAAFTQAILNCKGTILTSGIGTVTNKPGFYSKYFSRKIWIDCPANGCVFSVHGNSISLRSRR